MDFDPRPYVKEIARGPHGRRDLTREQARELFAAIFAGKVLEAALGGVLVALRMKGETADEVAGMMEALAAHVAPLRLPPGGVRPLLLGSYNGARKIANLVPLLALLLARAGVPVLVHGVSQEASRVATFEILERLGHGTCASLEEAQRRLESERIACVPLALLSPALARLVAMRLALGVRNTGHTLAKLLLPAHVDPRAACRLVSVTHPGFVDLMRAYFAAVPGDALLLRGVEGEPVVRLHAPQPIEAVGGVTGPQTLRIDAADASYALPERDAGSTARWTREVLEGRIAAPAALAAEAALIAEHCRR